MKIKSEQLFTSAVPKTTLGKIGQFPITRIFIAMIFLLPIILIHKGAKALIDLFPEWIVSWLNHIEIIAMFFLLLFAYRIYVKIIEKRQAFEISAGGLWKESAMGFLIGGGLITSVVLILAALGYYKIIEFNSPLVLLTAFIVFGIGAFIEEVVFRLILFRLVEELLGSWIAIVLLAVLFGFAHIGNENATIITSVAIVLEAGILIAAAFMYTRRIWLIFGIHLAWNYFQSGIWGIRTSGEEFTGLISPEIQGPTWLTGGSFGIEGSVLTVVFCLIIGIILLKLAINKNQLVMPAWKRKRIETTEIE